MSRNGYKINRQSGEYERSNRVDWLDQLATDLDGKHVSAVQVARNRNQSVTDQMHSIVNNRPVHATVDSVVKEMQERVGLSKYLKIISNNTETKKTAQQKDIFAEYGIKPETKEKIIDFINHKLENEPYIQLTVLREEITPQFKDMVDGDFFNSESFGSLLNKMMIEKNVHKKDFDENLSGKKMNTGDIDDNANTDFFAGLMPST